VTDGWIGVDLDGTLAYYDQWRGISHIGAPIAPMVSLVRRYLARGQEVRIFTARVGDPGYAAPIQAWCEKHIGRVLPITNVKDFACIMLYDDRAIQVVQNRGELVQ